MPRREKNSASCTTCGTRVEQNCLPYKKGFTKTVITEKHTLLIKINTPCQQNTFRKGDVTWGPVIWRAVVMLIERMLHGANILIREDGAPSSRTHLLLHEPLTPPPGGTVLTSRMDYLILVICFISLQPICFTGLIAAHFPHSKPHPSLTSL